MAPASGAFSHRRESTDGMATDCWQDEKRVLVPVDDRTDAVLQFAPVEEVKRGRLKADVRSQSLGFDGTEHSTYSADCRPI